MALYQGIASLWASPWLPEGSPHPATGEAFQSWFSCPDPVTFFLGFTVGEGPLFLLSLPNSGQLPPGSQGLHCPKHSLWKLILTMRLHLSGFVSGALCTYRVTAEDFGTCRSRENSTLYMSSLSPGGDSTGERSMRHRLPSCGKPTHVVNVCGVCFLPFPPWGLSFWD